MLSYIGEVNAQLGPTQEVLALRQDVLAQRIVTMDDLETVAMPERWLSSAMLAGDQADIVIGQITRLDQPRGAIVQHGMFGPQPKVGIGQVEISTAISADSAIGGSVRPGDVVHVQAAYLNIDGSRAVRQIIEGALVLHVGIGAAGEGIDSNDSTFVGSEMVPITFALDADAASCLTYAENFAEDLLLARPGEFARSASGTSNCPSSWETGFDADIELTKATEPSDLALEPGPPSDSTNLSVEWLEAGK